MRARELLEDYNQNLQSDLSNLLVSAKGNGAEQVQTQNIVKQLFGMGYSVNINSILPLLSNNPLVSSATPEMITLTAEEGQEGANQEQDSASRVSDMAQTANPLGT